MRKYIFIFILLIQYPCLAQELNCNVIIDVERVQTQEKRIFESMKTAFTEFMNRTRWTTDNFEPFEKITCNIVIQLNQNSNVANGSFSGTAQIQAVRPVYGSEYESMIYNYIDPDFNFVYTEGLNLVFTDNVLSSNLTSMLAFHAYMILGFDYNSFSKQGGKKYFEKARDVANTAQSDSELKGWKPFGNPNDRFALMEQCNSPQMDPLLTGYYNYHRIALDQLSQKPVESQKIILQMLQELKKVRDLVPTSILLETFFMAKSNELVNIFSGADRATKQAAVDILARIDPTNNLLYQRIMLN